METSHIKQTALVLARLYSRKIIRICVYVPRIVAMATIEESIVRLQFEGSNYLKAVSIQRNTVFRILLI